MKKLYTNTRQFFTVIAWMIGLSLGAIILALIFFLLKDVGVIKELQSIDLSKPHSSYD